MCGLCYTHWYVESAEIRRSPISGSIPLASYGPLFSVFFAFMAGTILCVAWLYIINLRRSSGMQRVELQFILAAGGALVFVTLVDIALIPLLPREQFVWVAPLRVIVFSIVIAYGIATRKIMDVGTFLRRLVSYALLSSYLVVVYSGIWWTSTKFLQERFPNSIVPHVLAALAVALSMAPARGVSKNFADKLFINSRGLDFQTTVRKAATILGSVTTLDDLLIRFAATIAEAVGTDRVSILLLGRNFYETRQPATRMEHEMRLPIDGEIARFLNSQREPVILDQLYRTRPTPEVLSLLAELKANKVAAATGVFSRDQLVALMLLGPRLSGRIYGSVEQNALQILSGQLAVAIENAKLFTEVQNAKIYNDILLQNLTTGIIAADADGQITVFNKEAEQITGIQREEILDRTLGDLPESLRHVLQETIASRERKEHHEVTIRSDAGTAIVRVSSSIFHDQGGEMLGVLLVFTDITALKRLELQIRRSDRLASLGTLSAGMAHEIKNPLVSIKTFAQLLPERYQDSDFRETFSKLIGHEIDRIDSLVNQLLRFARPAKPLLRPMHVHETLEKSLLLVKHRLYQKEISLTRDWQAKVDTIRADSDQIEQVFLNFFLNAMEAMKPGGQLTVKTEITSGGDDWSNPLSPDNRESQELLRVSICDTGAGIRAEDIPHVFDPFFTTKDYGTGLGLSVVHGIIEEHGGQIEVESELSKGTAFHIVMPLARIEQEVAAA